MALVPGKLEIFLAVAHHGSVTGAARTLNLSRAEIEAGLADLERRFGSPLFTARPDGLVLTAVGADLLPFAEERRREIRSAATGVDDRPGEVGFGGVVRIAAGSWMSQFVARRSGELLSGLPDLTIALKTELLYVSLTRHDADLALRQRHPDDGRYVLHRLPDVAYAVYGSAVFVEREPDALTEARYELCPWVGFDAESDHLPTARWLRARVRKPMALLCTRPTNVLDGIKAGLGLGLLPCFAGEREDDLIRLTAPVDLDTHGLWLVAHEEMHRAPAAELVFDRLIDLFDRERDLLWPEEPAVSMDQ